MGNAAARRPKLTRKGWDFLRKREQTFALVNRIFVAAIVALHLGFAFTYLLRDGDSYLFQKSLLGLPLLLLPTLVFRIFRLKTCHQLNFWVYLFIFLAHTIGITITHYNIPYYDKAMHTLSGVFVAFLALCCFYFFKPGREIDRKDGPLCCLFVFAVSMAVAGLWEIGEYTVSCIDGSDPQLVLSTGVGDTMQDMIVCMVGTLLFVGVLAHWYLRRDDRRSGPLMGAFDTFYQYNLAPRRAAGQGGEKE